MLPFSLTAGKILSGLGGLFGGLADVREVAQTRSDIKNMAAYNPFNAGGFGGSVHFNGRAGNFQLSPDQQLMQAMLGGQGLGLLSGGLFNSPQLQQALSQNNIAGALGQANSALAQQASPFVNQGMFSNLMGNVNSLGNMFAGQTAAGPQDFSGGLQANLFSRGSANQEAAGNQQGLFNQSLALQRAAAEPAQTQLLNQLENRLFSRGQLGSTGGAMQMQGFIDAIGAQDLGFQNNAFQQALAQGQFLGNLGSQQINQGTDILGLNLGQFNQNAINAQNFMGLGAGLEGQGFNQMLQALQQNQSAGLNRLQAAQGLFGLGTDTFNQQFGLGLGAQQGLMDQSRLGLDSILGLLMAESDRIGATSGHAGALAKTQESSGGILGGLLGGIGKALGGLF